MTKLEAIEQIFKGQTIHFEGIDYSEEANDEFIDAMTKLNEYLEGLRTGNEFREKKNDRK